MSAGGVIRDEFLEMLRAEFPEFAFRAGRRFSFRYPKSIYFDQDDERGELLILHELGHAILRHRDFKTGAERLKMEQAAWEKARELSERFAIPLDEDLAQAELDTYRDWLDKKSRCPRCGLTRYQTPDGAYHCPRCENFS